MAIEYLTPAEIAATLRVTPHAVTKWCRTGKLKAIRAGDRWRIAPADLEEFVRQGMPQEQGPKANDLAFAH